MDAFTLDTIDVAMVWGILKIEAHRYGYFGVHRHVSNNSPLWRITHLPSARCFAWGFPSLDEAAKAAVEIHALRNDWAVIADPSEYSPEFRQRAFAIVAAHGGKVGGKDSGSHRPAFNGYNAVLQ